MRRVLAGDVLALARVVSAEGQGAAARLLDEADAADRHRRRLGRCHPAWGNGSLMSRCLTVPAPALPEGSDDWTCALHAATGAIAAWRRARRPSGRA